MDEKINQLIESLEKALSNAEGPEYRESMTDKEVDELLKARTIKIDALTAVEIIEVLKKLPFEKKLLRGCIDRIDTVNRVGNIVEEATGRDKQNAYRQAAVNLGWTDGKKKSDEKLLAEYLDLIGVVHLYTEEKGDFLEFVKADPPEPMGKEEAIEHLHKKHNIKSYEATYQRLKRAKKHEKKLLKLENKDFSHLINILPTYIDNSGPV